MNEFWWSLLIFIIFTLIFFLIISEILDVDRCPYPGGKCFDGNGRYQYKGRGCECETIDILLSRIDWLAKNSSNKPLYSTAYIISFAVLLAMILILYGYSGYILSPWELIIIIFSVFIIVFSIINLLNFHTNRYNSYYIRNNIDYISEQLRINIKNDPPRPCDKTYVPHRNYVRDLLCK